MTTTPGAEFTGAGSISSVGTLLDHYGAQRVLLVTSPGLWVKSGAEEALASDLASRTVTLLVATPNPRSEDVAEGVRLLLESGCDLILAVGGGSALDLAKMVNACAHAEAPAAACIRGEAPVSQDQLPLLAVPTTSGTGAEATHFATVYIDGVKFSLADPSMRPDHVVLDPQLTASLPPYLTACTGIDALSQAIEAYWSVNSTNKSRAHSTEAIRLIAPALEHAVNAPGLDDRERMLIGANLAGKAIDVARTTAPHALSYLVTSRFGVAHGHAVGLSLGAVFEYNSQLSSSDASDPRGATFSRARIEELGSLLGCDDAAAARARLTSLMQGIGLKTRLRDFDVARSDIPSLVTGVNVLRLANNPRSFTPESMGRVLEEIY